MFSLCGVLNSSIRSIASTWTWHLPTDESCWVSTCLGEAEKYIHMKTSARAWPTHPSSSNGGEIGAETTPLLTTSPYQTRELCVCLKAWSSLDGQACLWGACGPE